MTVRAFRIQMHRVRFATVAWIVLGAVLLAGCVSVRGYPAIECGKRDAESGETAESQCIARLFPAPRAVAAQASASAEPLMTQAHRPAARMEPVDGDALCIPRNYLELWDPARRRESERICNVPPESLAHAGRYFDCIQTREDGCSRPAIAVALEGGGSKSAPFSLGVLAGLQRSGVLPEVDLVGSASGGSYAAYFYFSRLMERELEPEGTETDPSAWFRDCMPSYYLKKGVAGDKLLPDSDYCQELDLADGTFHKLTEGNKFERGFEYQYQAKVGRDLLALHQSLRLRREAFNVGDFGPAALGVSFLAVQHALTAVPHLFTNALFDWPWNYSPSREAYRSGIERAYGYSARDWHEALRREGLDFAPPAPNDRWIGTRFERQWRMRDLEQTYVAAHSRCKDLRGPCGFPLWVLSTASSAGRSHDFWIKPQPRDFQRFSFELGPRGHGSGLLGFLDAPPDMALRDAVGASAAFLDDQQRLIVKSTAIRALASSFVFFANANWGANIANFNTSDAKRIGGSVTPFPGYWLPYFQGVRAGHIHLADGGNVDNLGVVALLRRGVRNIVVSASTDDLDGELPSLCKLKNELELQVSRNAEGAMDLRSVYDVRAPALGNLGRVCNRQLDRQEVEVYGRDAVRRLVCERLGPAQCDAKLAKVLAGEHEATGYNWWSWPIPVIEACVIRRRDPASDAIDAETCEEARAAGRELTRLYIIKPAVSRADAHAPQMSGSVIRGCAWGNDGRIRGEPLAAGIVPGMDLPCAALAYMSGLPSRQQTCGDRRQTFPQDDFIGMTIHSGYTLYGAYYDLGRHRAAQIRLGSTSPQCGGLLCLDHPYRRDPVQPCMAAQAPVYQ